ncbi:hypothetical protein APY04_2164 [Hyphomicrobium sulfonivorans]|uniref:Uncharacterized protein n=1 Tax=Hyphomicrobium sulfonivorans TaxID=121290 RepID=A0A109BDN4_HYPSL|nr:hypothetical protein APY04_2164 [Hyphomicrobium sulfonivorans]
MAPAHGPFVLGFVMSMMMPEKIDAADGQRGDASHSGAVRGEDRIWEHG